MPGQRRLCLVVTVAFIFILPSVPVWPPPQTEAAGLNPLFEPQTAPGSAQVATPTFGFRPQDISPTPPTGPGPAIAWIREFGTDNTDGALAVAAFGPGSVYVAGYAYGAFPGETALGGRDAFLAKLDGSGNVLWARQFGASQEDYATAVAVDGPGNVYVAGDRDGYYVQGPQSLIGGFNGFICKYDSSGNQLWARTFSSGNTQYTYGVAVDSYGNVYAAGYTYGVFEGQIPSGGSQDAFVVSYDSVGNMRWARQFGTGRFDAASGIAADGAGNVYVTGSTGGTYPGQVPAGGNDAYIRKYDSAGYAQWTKQFGTSLPDYAQGIAVDGSGNIYVTGDTYGAFPGQAHLGLQDAFVARFDSYGNLIWTRQFGTDANEYAKGIAVDGSGNIFLAGETYGSFPFNLPSSGGWDIYISSYNNLGDWLWSRQFGTSLDDHIGGITRGSPGNVYVAGSTNGVFPGQTRSGWWDAFVAGIPGSVPATPTPSPFPSLTPMPSPLASPTPAPTPFPSPTPGPFPTPTLTPGYLPGDVNRDGRVDAADLNLLMASFNKRAGDAGFDPNADFNGDGIVDVFDLATIGLNFGRTQ
ncbi:MAG: SBBP repeat-containing protein [Chloroflexi bacterium]|nr:SBBP repeat-containing protein [Chloroflexota bacterium]